MVIFKMFTKKDVALVALSGIIGCVMVCSLWPHPQGFFFGLSVGTGLGLAIRCVINTNEPQ